jgi:RNA polymerase sigma-70 factor (ECF subfamily)
MPILRMAVGAPGDWLMIPTTANGQPAAAAYHRDAGGAYQAYGIAVIAPTASGVAGIVVFGDPGLFSTFGLPPHRPPA